MKILTLDIETSPNVAHVWGLWNNNVGLNQLLESGEMLCFAAKWYEDDDVMFFSKYHHSTPAMVAAAWQLMDEADVLVHYNGNRFDIPHLHRAFLEENLNPPSPSVHVDLLRTVKKQFRFPSNKLDYVANRLGIGSKKQHEGHTLWVRCLNDDPEAWDIMREYNDQDVRITEKLYDKLKLWIPGHPNIALYGQDPGDTNCPHCGSESLVKRGKERTVQSVFQRYCCSTCGKWSRSTKRIAGVHIKPITS